MFTITITITHEGNSKDFSVNVDEPKASKTPKAPKTGKTTAKKKKTVTRTKKIKAVQQVEDFSSFAENPDQDDEAPFAV